MGWPQSRARSPSTAKARRGGDAHRPQKPAAASSVRRDRSPSPTLSSKNGEEHNDGELAISPQPQPTPADTTCPPARKGASVLPPHPHKSETISRSQASIDRFACASRLGPPQTPSIGPTSVHSIKIPSSSIPPQPKTNTGRPFPPPNKPWPSGASSCWRRPYSLRSSPAVRAFASGPKATDRIDRHAL